MLCLPHFWSSWQHSNAGVFASSPNLLLGLTAPTDNVLPLPCPTPYPTAVVPAAVAAHTAVLACDALKSTATWAHRLCYCCCYCSLPSPCCCNRRKHCCHRRLCIYAVLRQHNRPVAQGFCSIAAAATAARRGSSPQYTASASAKVTLNRLPAPPLLLLLLPLPQLQQLAPVTAAALL